MPISDQLAWYVAGLGQRVGGRDRGLGLECPLEGHQAVVQALRAKGHETLARGEHAPFGQR